MNKEKPDKYKSVDSYLENWELQYIPKKYIDITNRCIKNKNLNLILDIATKSIGTSTVCYGVKNYVYFLLEKNEIVYIGQSSCRNRIGKHKKTKKFDSVYYLPLERGVYESFERLLIANFKTKYNCCNVAKSRFYEQGK